MIWGMTLHPGEEWTREIHCNERLTLAALECRPGKNNGEPNPASCLLLKIGNNDHVICTLEKGSIPQQNLDLVLQQKETVTFIVEGTGIVYLTGYNAGDSVNTCEDTSMFVQTNPLIQEEATDDTLADYNEEEQGAIPSGTDLPSKEGSLDDVQEIKEEVDANDFQDDEEEEELSDQMYGTDDDPSPSRKTLNGPPQETETDSVKGTKHREEMSAFEKQVLAAYEEGTSMGLAARSPPSGNISSDHSAGENPGSSDGGLEYDAEDRPSVVGAAADAREASSLQAYEDGDYEDGDYETLFDHTSRVAGLPRPDKKYRRRRKTSYFGNQTIKSSPASITYPVCAKSFKNRSTLRSKHLIDGKYNRLFSYCRNLQLHHDGTVLDDRLQTSDFRPFKCQYCGKPFLRKACVRVHERIHTGERPFKCKYCSKTFNQKAHVQSHEIIHTGDKNFKCQYCDKAFAHLSTARRHERIHMRDPML